MARPCWPRAYRHIITEIAARNHASEGDKAMTTPRQDFGPMRSHARSNRDRILSAGLATAACAGLVGVIGVRSIEHSAATESASSSQGVATTTSGLSQAELNAYADQLQQQSLKLDAYRASLVTWSTQLQAAGKKAPKPVAKPAPRPVAKPAPAAKPASTTKSS